ncbi:hypothetical protein NQ318_020371, partial [Aromia moschata]
KEREEEELKKKEKEKENRQERTNQETVKGSKLQDNLTEIREKLKIIVVSISRESAGKIAVNRGDQSAIKEAVIDIQDRIIGFLGEQVEVERENGKLKEEVTKLKNKIREQEKIIGDKSKEQKSERKEKVQKESEKGTERQVRMIRESVGGDGVYERLQGENRDREYPALKEPAKTYAEMTGQRGGQRNARIVTNEDGWVTPPIKRKWQKRWGRNWELRILGGHQKGVRLIRGGRVCIEARDDEQLARLEREINNREGMNCRRVRNSDPMVIISGVNEGIEEGEFIREIIRGNEELTGTGEDEIKIIRKIKCRNPWKNNWVLQTREYLGLAMCFRCCRFGHIAKYCRENDICYRCGKGHDSRECRETGERCINCLRMFGKAGEHNARDTTCPAFRMNMESGGEWLRRGAVARTIPPQGYRTYGREGGKVLTIVREGVRGVWMRDEWTNANVVVIQVERKGKDARDLMIVNVYDEPPQRDRESRMKGLKWIKERTEGIVIGGDMNAKYSAWGRNEIDERGEEVYEWAIMNGFRIENGSGDEPSFFSTRGRSWIDLVMSRWANVYDREIWMKETLSDHRYVAYRVALSGNDGARATRPGPRYVITGAKWEEYQDELCKEWRYERVTDEKDNVRERLEEEAQKLQKACEAACEKGLERKRGRKREQNEWWNRKSAKAIEKGWDECWKVCTEWARENKLAYNVAKTEAMFVPAGREIREPVVKMEDERIEMKGSIKYLGVRVDRKLMWLDHVKEIRKKVQEVGGKFFALARRKWGSRKEVLKVIYERVVCPMILYGAEIWGERRNDSRVVKQLRAIERPYLRSMTRAYRTAPTAALSVLAGCVPLEVQVGVRYERETEWGERMKEVKVVTKDRPHPSIRGIMPTLQGGRTITVYTDATRDERGRHAWGWVWERGGTWIGQGGQIGEGANINITEATGGIENHKTQIKIIVEIQREIGEAWGEGIRVRVLWEKRGSRGNIKAEQMAKEALGREGETLREIATKGRVKEWVGRMEMDKWQKLWDEGRTGRWLYGMWSKVLTGHGDMRAYLVRFRLTEGGGECECGLGDESVEHIVFECEIDKRKRAREKMRERGDYPPRMDELHRNEWEGVIEWANELMEKEE